MGTAVAGRGEEHREHGSRARERAADDKTVVASETDAHEHRLGREGLDGIQCGRSAARLRHHGVATPHQRRADVCAVDADPKATGIRI